MRTERAARRASVSTLAMIAALVFVVVLIAVL